MGGHISMEVPFTPLDFARRTRRLHRHRPAGVAGDLRLTYQQFLGRYDRASAALERLGVRPGDRVAVIAPNTHSHLEQYYAVPQLGAVLVPVNFRLTGEDWAFIVEHAGGRVVLGHSDQLDAIDAAREGMPGVEHFIALEGARDGWLDYEALLAQAPPTFTRPESNESDLLTINYTSGTTARPKGVMITHRNAWVNVIGTLLHLDIGVGDRYLWTLPMFHANGWSFPWVVTAGAPPAAVTIEKVEGELGWEVTHVYGLTETSPFISVCAPLPEHAALPSGERAMIKARQGVELLTSGDLRVVNTDSGEVPWDGQSLGEIVVRGIAVMAGYYRDPEATQACMGDGWFHTGDAAVVHPDGYIEIRDRIKDVIISGGENISSVEVEGLLLRHEAVQEVAVVGMPSEKWGESPHAFVVLRPGASAS